MRLACPVLEYGIQKVPLAFLPLLSLRARSGGRGNLVGGAVAPIVMLERSEASPGGVARKLFLSSLTGGD